MARVLKVIVNGVEIEAGGEVEVHVQDGPVERTLTFGDDVREQVFKGDYEVSDEDLSYDDLFGNSADCFEDDEEDEEEDVCYDCGEHVCDCTCYDGEDDEGGDDDDGEDPEAALQTWDDLADEDEPWGPDDVVSLTSSGVEAVGF